MCRMERIAVWREHQWKKKMKKKKKKERQKGRARDEESGTEWQREEMRMSECVICRKEPYRKNHYQRQFGTAHKQVQIKKKKKKTKIFISFLIGWFEVWTDFEYSDYRCSPNQIFTVFVFCDCLMKILFSKSQNHLHK